MPIRLTKRESHEGSEGVKGRVRWHCGNVSSSPILLILRSRAIGTRMPGMPWNSGGSMLREDPPDLADDGGVVLA